MAGTPVLTDSTTVSFEISLQKPGDYFEFIVETKNMGSLDAMIDTYNLTVTKNDVEYHPNYLNFQVKYFDDVGVAEKQILTAGSIDYYKVRVEFKKDINANDLVHVGEDLSLTVKAIDTRGKNIIVSAGAGSGKTFVLKERVLKQVQNETSVENLVILTFTKNAAMEMKERIRKIIGEHPELAGEAEIVTAPTIGEKREKLREGSIRLGVAT